MRKNLHWSVQLAGVLALIGVLVLKLSFWLGASLILVGLAVSIVALRQSRKTTLRAQKPKSGAVRATAAPEEPVHHTIDHQKLGLLRYTLHQANLDSHASVFETDEHKVVTVSDILVEMIDIAETYGRSVEELAKDIVAIYPKIFDNVPLALRQYPDEALAKTYIARKAMTDVHWKLDHVDANRRGQDH